MNLLIKIRLWLQHLRAIWHYWLGAAHRHWGNTRGDVLEYEEAVRNFSLAIDLDPTMPQAYLDRGILYWRELNHPRKALLDLNQALELDPELHEARFNRGLAYQQLGEYQRARAEFLAYLDVGEHPHWLEYAEKMVEELGDWRSEA